MFTLVGWIGGQEHADIQAIAEDDVRAVGQFIGYEST